MKLKLLTFYSDTHDTIYTDYFLNSYNKHLSDSFELIVRKIDQVSQKGGYYDAGFWETMVEKLKLIVENIEVGNPDPFVYADCDIQFFGDFKDDIINELGDYDIKFQDDKACRCAGFFIAKQNQEVKDFFQALYDSNLKIKEDQTEMNRMLNNEWRGKLKEGMLPWQKYYTAVFNVGSQWDGQDFIPPNTVLMHHANWTVGVENKIKLMDLVKNKLGK